MPNLKYLQTGDIVDIVFPSNCPTLQSIASIKNYIKSLGLTPRIFEEEKIFKTDKKNYIIFSNKFKLEQLYKALSAKDSKLVWYWAGGYGSGELIQKLQKKKKIKQKKFLITYSDGTFISSFLQQKWGWKTLYASTISDMILLNQKSKKFKKALLNTLFGRKNKPKLKLDLINDHKFKKPVKAETIGGCLTILLSSFGTKNQIKCKNKILFLEDTGETGFRLMRKFNQIADFIIDNKQIPQAVILGDFKASNSRKGSDFKLFETIIKQFNEKLKEYKIHIPIFYSQNLGHVKNMHPLHLGEKTTIFAKNQQIILE
jgi:muramoyltetrapeptide carboxypeptidase